jgi:hypothetical protein
MTYVLGYFTHQLVLRLNATPGNETAFFGRARAAVIDFQKTVGILTVARSQRVACPKSQV